VARGLLPYPGHQEDVVVDAQRHQEHEHVQRERGVRAAEVQQVPEHQRTGAHRRGQRRHHGGDQHQRRDHRPQQQRQDDQHHDQHDRDDQHPVVRGGPPHVQVDRGTAADLGVRPRHRVHRVPYLASR
jgi:hypothetical protein